MPALISYIDSDQRYQFSNQAYEEWFGEKADGRKLDQVLGAAAYRTISKYVDAALRGERVSYQMEIPYQDGGARFVDATYVPDKNKDGTIRGFYALVQDITQRKQEEQDRDDPPERRLGDDRSRRGGRLGLSGVAKLSDQCVLTTRRRLWRISHVLL